MGKEYNAPVLTFRAGNPSAPRGHALLFFQDANAADTVWATYLVVVPIAMDLTKYLPAALAPQMVMQAAAAVGPAAYPLPPVPEKVEGGLPHLEHLAALRGDDVLDGGVLSLAEPWQALQPVNDIGTQYAEAYTRYLTTAPGMGEEAAPQATAEATSNVDDLLLQMMSDREKIERVARLTGSLRYAIDGGDEQLADETVQDMLRVGRQLPEKYRLTDLIGVARESGERAAALTQLFVERCYKLADEDYGALADLDRRISDAQQA